MRQESVVAYIVDEADQAAVRAAIEQLRLSGDVKPGGVDAALADAKSWLVVPDYMILDVSKAEDPVQAISAVAASAPEGNTNLVVIGVDNDIVLYRRLKAIGAAECLARPVTTEHLIEVVTGIVKGHRADGKAIEPSRLVAIVGVRGGAGVSTIAAAVADATSSLHRRKTLLVDTDFECGVQHILWGTQKSSGMLDMLQEPSRLDAHLFDRVVQRPRPSLSLLSMSGLRGLDPPTIHAEGLKALVLQAHRGIDNVVLDMPCRGPVGRAPLLSAGTTFIVATPTLPGIHDTIQLLNVLESAGHRHKSVVLVNKVGEARSGVVRAAIFREKVSAPIIELPFDQSVPQAQFEMKSLLNLRGPFRKAFERVLEQLPTHEASAVKTSFLDKLLGSR